jgi:NAD-dependent dihydropyrimidine dehydrogenase PreA subunit
MSIEIYYFSGTGNSLHVARELCERMPEARLTPIVHLLQQDTIKTSADTIGFVFPNFCLTIPIPLHDFLEKADLASAQYIFALCTRGGSQSEAFEYMNQMLKGQGKQLNAQMSINMPWNHMITENLPATTNSEQVINRLESVMQGKLDVFAKAVAARERYLEPGTDASFQVSLGIRLFDLLVPKSLNCKSHDYMYQRLVRFYSDSKCTGCGVCEKVCSSGRIALGDNKPVWKRDVRCYACFACINFCPQQAIQVESRFPIKSNTDVNDRYHHPSVTYKDIAGQR